MASCVQEQVSECRELNTTAEWLAVASAVNPLAMSMPLLLHHQVSQALQPAVLTFASIDDAIAIAPMKACFSKPC